MTRVAIDMSGKVALVTGGGYGMGRASARQFASCGARVAIADIDEARGAETVYKGNASDAAYTTSKHAVWGRTTVAALRYVKHGIRVNAVAADTGWHVA
jgi:NAD(P)-dependent dehydrogenase (short-subunit alcohol dehydrogenase family)